MNPLQKITATKNQNTLEEHLKNYEKKALELGASKAAIIRAGDIPVDERVNLKCQIPRCVSYGCGVNCPPNTLKPAELRAHLAKYQWAVLFSIDVPPEVIVKNEATTKERMGFLKNIYKIAGLLESMAFYDGHYFAFGLGVGSCRNIFCGQFDTCAAFEGKRCRFPLKSRPSMEAVGIDVYSLLSSSGWEIYPVGCNIDPACVPKSLFAGIVIVQ